MKLLILSTAFVAMISINASASILCHATCVSHSKGYATSVAAVGESVYEAKGNVQTQCAEMVFEDPRVSWNTYGGDVVQTVMANVTTSSSRNHCSARAFQRKIYSGYISCSRLY